MPSADRLSDIALDLFALASHLTIAFVAAVGFEATRDLPFWAQFVLSAMYVTLALWLYSALKRRRDRLFVGARAEVDTWKRFRLLQSSIVAVLSQFLKDCYRVNRQLASDLSSVAKDDLSVDLVIEGIEKADSERRQQIKTALHDLASYLKDDEYLKPTDATTAVQDNFKISFYGVEKVGNSQSLKPKYRSTDIEPTTKEILFGEGGSGTAWSTKRVVVCPNGGDSPPFEEMWTDQRRLYASMVCIPAIEDIPAEKYSEVVGVLTVDSSKRRGYFNKDLQDFWRELFEPICNLVVYCNESYRTKQELIAAVRVLEERLRSGTAASS